MSKIERFLQGLRGEGLAQRALDDVRAVASGTPQDTRIMHAIFS